MPLSVTARIWPLQIPQIRHGRLDPYSKRVQFHLRITTAPWREGRRWLLHDIGSELPILLEA
jgi:hypothetical protein